MTVQSTPNKPYYDEDSQRAFATQREFICNLIQNFNKPSIADIRRCTRLKKNQVYYTVREMEKAGCIHKGGIKIDPYTKRKVNWYAPN